MKYSDTALSRSISCLHPHNRFISLQLDRSGHGFSVYPLLSMLNTSAVLRILLSATLLVVSSHKTGSGVPHIGSEEDRLLE